MRPRGTPPIPTVRTALASEVEMARGLRESGGASYPMGAVSVGELLQIVGGLVTGISPSELVATGHPAPPRPTFTSTQMISWAQLSSVSNGSNALFGNTLYFLPHVEEQDVATYDALAWRMAVGSGAGGLGKAALYDVGSDGNPDSLLWSSADTSIAAGAIYLPTFSSGSWTTAGGPYQDGSQRLVLRRGQAVWLAWMRNGVGAPSSQTPAAGSLRGWATSSTFQSGQGNGFTSARSFALGFPDPAGALADSNGQMPLLALRWV